MDQILACFELEREVDTDEEEIVNPVSIAKVVVAVDQLHQYEISKEQASLSKVQVSTIAMEAASRQECNKTMHYGYILDSAIFECC